MGSIFKTPKYRPDPELEKQKRELAAKVAKEKEEAARRKKDKENRIRLNQIGSNALKDDEMEGTMGFKPNKKLMGGKKGYSNPLTGV